MIFLIILICIGTHHTNYNCDKNRNQYLTPVTHRSQEEGQYTPWQNPANISDVFHINGTRRVPTHIPTLYYEDFPDDPYQTHMEKQEKKLNRCKTVCAATTCLTCWSVVGCLLFKII